MGEPEEIARRVILLWECIYNAAVSSAGLPCSLLFLPSILYGLARRQLALSRDDGSLTNLELRPLSSSPSLLFGYSPAEEPASLIVLPAVY